MSKRGFAGLCFYQGRFSTNMGTAWRSAYIFGLDFLATIGTKYKPQAGDTCKAFKHLPYYHYQAYNDFVENLPMGCEIVCVELSDKARSLENFVHPDRAVYLMGNETYGIHQKYLDNHLTVQIPSVRNVCLNVAVSAPIVMYDRMIKRREHGQDYMRNTGDKTKT